MSDDLVKRLRAVDISWSQVGEDCAAAADEIERLNAENARLREALEKIAALDVPPSVMTRYREDEQPSEDDLCPHLLPMSEDCPDCIADYARAALADKEKK